ncbi:MAG: hypothetical protein WKG01_06805 [Kofleriaceae bacterium]
MIRIVLALGLAVAGIAACDRVVDLTPLDGAAGPADSSTPDTGIDGPDDGGLEDAAVSDDGGAIGDGASDAL